MLKNSEVIKEYIFSWRKAIILALLIILSVLCFNIGQLSACRNGALVNGLCYTPEIIGTVNVCEFKQMGGVTCSEFIVNDIDKFNEEFNISFN